MENFFGCADLFEFAFLKHSKPIAHVKRFFLIVCHKNNRRLHGLENAAHMFAHPGPQVCIEAAEGFVHEHKHGSRSERTRQCHTLTFPAGEFVRVSF